MTSEQPPDSRSPGAGRTTLLIIFLIVFIDLLGFGIVLPLLPRYAATLQATNLQLGLLMASFSAMQFAFAPLWGAISDRVGRRPILLIGLIGSSAAYSLFGLASALGREGTMLGLTALPWLFLTRIGAGIAGATISTAQAVIADTTSAEARGRGMALIGAAFGVGFTFGPLIGAACVSDDSTVTLNESQYALVKSWPEAAETLTPEQLVTELSAAGPVSEGDRLSLEALAGRVSKRSDLRAELLSPPSGTPGYIAGALSAIALILAALRLPETRRVTDPSGSVRHRRIRMDMVWRHLTAPRLSIILPAIFITTFGFAQFESTLSLLTQRFGYGTRWNFLLYAYVGFVLSIGQGMIVRRLLPRIGEQRMALLGVSLMTIGFVLVAMTGAGGLPPVALWIILPIIVIGFSAVTPSLNSLLSRAASGDEQGSVLGTGQSLSSLARILGPSVGIPLLKYSASVPYVLGAMLILFGGVLITRLSAQPPVESP